MVNPRRLRNAAERTAKTPMGMVGDAASSSPGDDEADAVAHVLLLVLLRLRA